MSVKLTYQAKFLADEIPALAVDLVTNPTIQHRLAYAGASGLIDGTTAAAIDDAYSDRRALVAGAYTLDLRALTSTLGTSKDFNGKKVKGIVICANPANTFGIVVTKGLTNGYSIWGSANGNMTVYPGFPVQAIFGNNLFAVSATIKTIDFASSQVDAEFEIILVVGA